jgi:hypothetical protein
MSASVSTTLLRIIAEAASAYRTGSDVYVVASVIPPHDREVFYTYGGSGDPAADAKRYLDSRPDADNWMLFGPFVTQTEGVASSVTALDYRVTVEHRQPDGTWTTKVYGEDEQIDALFLTLPAIDKFVVPYYVSVLGIERAQSIRDQFLENPTSHVHTWSTRWLL